MSNLKIVLSTPRNEALLLVTDADGEVMKARLPLPVAHPRAAVPLMERLALWVGSRVCAVISAGRASRHWSAVALFGPDGWPTESALGTWKVADGGHQVRLPGVADFRGLYAARVRA
jgi:hypothetical protein